MYMYSVSAAFVKHVAHMCTYAAHVQDMDYLKEQTTLFFDDLEKNGPPDWLVLNTHKIWHWADLLLRFGPVREWWMYAFESLNGKLARWVKNNAYPVASIMNGIRRLKTLASLRLRGIMSMLRNRQTHRPPLPRALMTRKPGIVVTTFGKDGSSVWLSDDEVNELKRWMRASVPTYQKLVQHHEEYDTYRQR
jgi:hypothetical protein